MNKKNYNLLIVEDETSMRELLADRFRMENFTVETAKNGQEALEIILKTKPDIILLDIIMPVMDGVTMVKELIKINSRQCCPIIFLTNVDDKQRVFNEIKDDHFEYIIKVNVNLDDLVDKVKANLEK